MNAPESKAALATVIETAISKQNGLNVLVTNVVATDVGGGRRRLLAGRVQVTFSLVVPMTAEGSQEQSVFDSLKTDLAAAAGSGGPIASGAAATFDGLVFDDAVFVAPNTHKPIDSASTCVGDHVIVSPSSGACTCGS